MDAILLAQRSLFPDNLPMLIARDTRLDFPSNLFRRFKNLNQYRISRYKMVITKEKSGSFSFSLPRKKSGKIRTDVPILSWPPSHSLCFLISTPSPFPRRFYRSWKLVNSQRRNPSWGKVRGGDTPLRCRVRGLFKERFVDSQHDKDISRLVVSCTLGWEAERNPSFRGPLRKDRRGERMKSDSEDIFPLVKFQLEPDRVRFLSRSRFSFEKK